MTIFKPINENEVMGKVKEVSMTLKLQGKLKMFQTFGNTLPMTQTPLKELGVL